MKLSQRFALNFALNRPLAISSLSPSCRPAIELLFLCQLATVSKQRLVSKRVRDDDRRSPIERCVYYVSDTMDGLGRRF